MISVIVPKCPSLTLNRTIICLFLQSIILSCMPAKQETSYTLLEHEKYHLHHPIPLFSKYAPIDHIFPSLLQR